MGEGFFDAAKDVPARMSALLADAEKAFEGTVKYFGEVCVGLCVCVWLCV